MKSLILLPLLCLCTLAAPIWAQSIWPYLQSPSENDIWVSWKTAAGTESVVEYGLDSLQLDLSQSGDYIALADDYLWHSVQMTGLKPGTPYFYRIRTDTAVSDIYRFVSQPSKGEQEGHLRFVVIGDHQRYSDQTYYQLAQACREKIQQLYGPRIEDHVQLMVQLGDQVDQGVLEQYENLQYLQSRPLMSNIPFMTVVGNHEYYGNSDLSNYFGHFKYEDVNYKGLSGPDGEHYYALQLGNVLFLMLNSNETWQRQVDWLGQVVQEASADPGIDWIFSACHHPIYAEQLPSDENLFMRNSCLPVMTQSKKYAMYFSGHAHLYSRGTLRNESVYQVINGGAAWDQFWGDSPTQKDYPDIQKTLERYIYQIIDIDRQARSMKVETYSIGNENMDLDNVLVDSYEMKLDAKGPDQPQLQATPDTLSLPFTFTGSAYSGTEAYNSTEFQVSDSTGSFDQPELTVKRDFENLFLSSGSPEYEPIDQNKGVDIFSLQIAREQLRAGEHKIRLRYRDRSTHWSDWSVPRTFFSLNGYEPPQQDPIAYFPFNGKANDESFHGFDGDNQGAVFYEDPERGPAAAFDDAGYIEIRSGAINTDSLPRAEITVAAWVKVKTADQWGGFIGYLQDNGSYEKGWVLGTRFQKFSIALASENGPGMTYLEDSEDFLPDTWYHVAATYNGQELRLFVNGKQKALSTLQSGDIAYPPAGWFRIGEYKDDDESYPHDGALDEIYLWERALAPQEILALYDPPISEPIAYYPFDDSALDASGHEFDATLQGNVTFDTHPLRGRYGIFDNQSYAEIRSGAVNTDSLPQREITCSAWVQVKDDDEWGGFFGYVHDTGDDESGWVLGSRYRRFSFALVGSNGAPMTYLSDTADFQYDTWYHVAATYDGQIMKLYINGHLVSSSAEQHGYITYPAAGWFVLGTYKDENEDWRHEGALDEVYLWERALSEAEILALYDQSSSHVQSLELDLGLEIYPNPAREWIRYRSRAYSHADEVQLVVSSLEGRILAVQPLCETEGRIRIDQEYKGVALVWLQDYRSKKPLSRTLRVIMK